MLFSDIEQSTCLIRPLYRLMSMASLSYSKNSLSDILFLSKSTLFYSIFCGFDSLITLAVWQRMSPFAEGLLIFFSFCKTYSCSFFSSYSNLVPFSIIFFKKILFLSLLSIFSANSLFLTLLFCFFPCFSTKYFLIISLCSFHNFF